MASRALIALAQLSIYAFTPFPYLTAQIGGAGHEEHCESSLQSWNFVCSGLPDEFIRWVMVASLLLVISGFCPRLTGILHLYIAIGTAAGLTHIDGGEAAAVVTLTWIAIICLFDGRWNGWTIDSERSPGDPGNWWSGIARAAAIALKVQCSIIYFHSATAKFGTEAWIDGSALYYVTRMDMFGVSGPLGSLALALTAHPLMSLTITYGVIAAELVIALIIWLPGRIPFIAVAISMALHIAIIVLLGIASFGLIMIGMVLASVVASKFVFRDAHKVAPVSELDRVPVG